MSWGRNDAIERSTEDKGWWCHHGERLELAFVDLCNKQLGLQAEINPEKSTNRFAPDLIVNGRVSDLKVQNTPFFVSSRYQMDPRRTVTFNRKDYERYRELYPDIDIYFWVDWKQTESKYGRVDYLAGIYKLPFQSVANLIEAGATEHTYIHRMGDTAGNAKSSFLLGLDNFQVLVEKCTK